MKVTPAPLFGFILTAATVLVIGTYLFGSLAGGTR
jgi:hypothetical protein